MFDFLFRRPKISNKDIVLHEIEQFKTSKKRLDMIAGNKYFDGEHDILDHKRRAIGEGGKLIDVENLPNNRIVDNQYRKMVLQKSNYLLGKPFSVKSESDQHSKLLNKIFNMNFLNLFNTIGEDALNCGLGLLFLYYDEQGKLAFKRFEPKDVILGWNDEEHTKLDYAIRLHEMQLFDGKKETTVQFVDVYDKDGIDFYELKDRKLTPVEPYHAHYFSMIKGEEEKEFNWSEIPIVAFKYNRKEQPLLNSVKSIQDAINLILSTFQNNMEEDVRSTILVLVNYDGQNLGEFRQNLATYGAVKVRTLDGKPGDLKTLQIEVNSENYRSILKILKKALIENAMGYDANDERLTGNPNQMNIQSIYSDIDLDANRMERQFQAAFEKMLFFVNSYLSQTGQGDFFDEEIKVIFDRDMLINEGEVIENCIKSFGSGAASRETIVSNHPWVDDPQAELEKIEKEKQAEMEQYSDAFAKKEVADEEEESRILEK